MAGPWERYQTQDQAGPWQKYATPAPAPDAEMQQPESGMNERAHVATGGFLEGLPVVGPLIRGGADRLGAGIRSYMYDTPYEDELSFVQGRSGELKQEMPTLDTASQIGGAVAGTLPLVAAAPAAFGAGGGSLLARSGASALSGASLATADAGVRTQGDIEAMKNAALWGGGLGLVGPAVGDLVGAGVRKVAERAGPTLSRAQRLFGQAAGRDAVDDVAARVSAMGPDAMPMDLGPNLQRQAGALAASPGEAQNTVRSAIAARDAGANARIMGSVDDALGRAPDMTAIQRQISDNMEALGPEYQKVFKNARRVDTTRIAHDLESKAINLRGAAQQAAKKVRNMLNVVGVDELDPNPRTLFETRQAIDGMLATETDPKAISLLAETRKSVDNRLAASVPGIKKVDARWAELARQREALGRGQQVLESGRTAPRPTDLADEFASGALPQGEMVGPSAVPMRIREGARSEIERIIGTNANDRVALQRLIKGEGDWNRSRLATLFGQDRADKIIRVLDVERAFADTSQTVTRNSETAARAAAMGEVSPQREPGLIRSALNMRFGDAAADIGDRAIGSARTATQQRSNEELARLLTSRDPKAITRTIQLVQNAARRGDISAQQAKQIVQGITLGGAQPRQPLELTVRP